jgi:putative ABC transport system permease protein
MKGYPSTVVRAMRAVAWRNLGRRRMRTFFTAAAVALGVANVFGVFVTNHSMQTAVERNTRSMTGGADAMARPEGIPWFRNADVKRMRELPDIRRALAWGRYMQLAAKGSMDVYLQAVDVEGTSELIDVREGRLPEPGKPEIALTVIAARVLDARIGDEVKELVPKKRGTIRRRDDEFNLERHPKGPITFTVSGIIADYPSTSRDYNYGSLTSNEFIWKLEEPDVIVEMGFLLDDGADPQRWASDAQVTLPNVNIRSSEIAPVFREFLRSFRALLAGTAALALIIGAFLVYLIFTLALAERTRLFGLLHAVGATRRQVASVVLREALMLGVVATACGLVIGAGLAFVLLRLVAAIGDFGIDASVRLSAPSFVAGILIGILTTLLGAAVPAVRAARMTPVEAVTGRTGSFRRPRAWIAGLPLFTGGTAIIALRGLGSDVLSQVAIASVMLGAVFIVPLGVGLLARTTKGVVTRLVPGSGVVVFRHLTKEVGRSAYTLSLVMLVLAAVVTLTSSERSLKENSDRIIDARFGADLIVYGPHVGRIEHEISTTRGVSGATTVTFGRRIGVVSKSTETVNLVLIDPDGFFDIAGFPWQAGDDAGARRALADGDGVLFPSRLAKRQGVRMGDTVRLRTGTTDRRYRVAGIYALGEGAPEIGVVGNVGDPALRPGPDAPTAVYLNLERGVSEQQALDRFAPVLREEGGLAKRVRWEAPDDGHGRGRALGPFFAISGAEIKQNAREDLDGYVRLFRAVIGVIVIAGALGMATALATSVVLRTRELGTITAIGATRKDIRRMIVAESVLLTAAAYVLAIGLGTLLAWLFIDGIAELTGSDVPVRFAWSALPVVGVLALVIAVVSAYVPARRAMRITPVEALRYE